MIRTSRRSVRDLIPAHWDLHFPAHSSRIDTPLIRQSHFVISTSSVPKWHHDNSARGTLAAVLQLTDHE